MPVLLGIDIGTTNTKIGIYNEAGEIMRDKIFTTPVNSDRHGMVYDPKEIINKLVKTISAFDLHIKKDIVALSVSSFAETMVGIDKYGKPITKCIAWFDPRTEQQFRQFLNQLDPAEVYYSTGLIPHHIYSFYKLLWHRDNDKENFNRVEHWTSMSGYILYEFSGTLSFDYSLASRTMFFHQQKRNWYDKMIQLIGITKEKLAKLVPSGFVLGSIKQEVSQMTGLQSDVLIVTGGHDHLCAALAVGVLRKGNTLISTGTTESITMSLEDIPRIDVKTLEKPFWWGHHTATNYFYALNGIYSGGFAVDWALKILRENYHLFEKLSLPSGKNLPIFLPYLRGANYKEARGAFLNLDGNVGGEDLLQGLITCLCFELRTVWEEMSEALGIAIKEVTNVGGGTNNEYWMKLKASILGHNIVVPKDKEGSLKGAALLAGIGCGIYKDANTAYRMTFKTDHIYTAVKELKEKLDRWYRVYHELFEDLKKINKKIYDIYSK